MSKRELVKILEHLAVILELAGENQFKVRAFNNAARALEQTDSTLAELVTDNGLENIKGIGKAISKIIREYVATGKIAEYQTMAAKVPPVLFELIKVPGLGPKKAMLLHAALNVGSLGELEYACRENRLVSLPGFGLKTQHKILAALEQRKQYQGRFLLSDAQPVAAKITEYLRYQPMIEQVNVAGSIRRQTPTVQDIELVAASSEPWAAVAAITAMPGVAQVIDSGDEQTQVVLVNGMRVSAKLVPPPLFASALLSVTGDAQHLQELQAVARAQGLTSVGINQAASEEKLYRQLGLAYIEPELREGIGEIAAAQAGKLPQLVDTTDLRGTFHVHTTYSDGSDTLAAMAAAAQQRGWQYIGIADHSRTAVYANGLKLETVIEQRREIDRLNTANPALRIFAGIESDILPDGSLDYPDEVLGQFDFVVASVHSSFRQSEAVMTERIIRAMGNRYVSMLGHATGRILLARDSYAVDLPAVIKAAGETGTIIEINASPYRLDLDWQWHRTAQAAGVLLAINPDAHAIAELDYVHWGVAMARKGWLTAADIVNTRPMTEVLGLLQQKRR